MIVATVEYTLHEDSDSICPSNFAEQDGYCPSPHVKVRVPISFLFEIKPCFYYL